MNEFILVVLVFWAAYSWTRADVATALLTTTCVLALVLMTPATWYAVGLVLIAAACGSIFGVHRGL